MVKTISCIVCRLRSAFPFDGAYSKELGALVFVVIMLSLISITVIKKGVTVLFAARVLCRSHLQKYLVTSPRHRLLL